MEHHQTVPTCTFKVNINCCTIFPFKVKEKLQKINGVESVVYDSKGVVTVSGKVNPMIIMKKLEKWGKKVEILSLEKSPDKQNVHGTGIENTDHGSYPKMNKDCSSHCDAISDSGSDTDDDCEARAAKKRNPNITCQYSDQITMNKQQQISTQRKGKKNWFLGLFCKKSGEGAKTKLDGGLTMLEKPASKVNGPSKWQFPKTPMLENWDLRPYYQPFEPYGAAVMGRPSAPPYHPLGLIHPLPPPLVPPPPQGFFNSKAPPKVNPMIHYTSYADNYSYW